MIGFNEKFENLTKLATLFIISMLHEYGKINFLDLLGEGKDETDLPDLFFYDDEIGENLFAKIHEIEYKSDSDDVLIFSHLNKNGERITLLLSNIDAQWVIWLAGYLQKNFKP